MTKEEIKVLVDKLTYENTNHCLEAQIFNALLEKIGGVTIDLGEYELGSDEVDVTDAIPAGYIPSIGDAVVYGGQTLSLSGSVIDEATLAWSACYGYAQQNGYNVEQVVLAYSSWNKKVVAFYQIA